ncbi:hydrolase [Thalassotalea sp. PLHSN55]|uniref:hydrolase n=1 Tax=Thalassotalea sp. PLHSN55 TaxID=3435888 RepID=UPI003F845EC0
MIQPSQFKVAWWLRNKHLQTISAKFFRRHFRCDTQHRLLNLPDDDFLELAWTEIPNADNQRPIVVILHGLEGSKDSHYAKGMLTAIKARGWIGVLMHFRGCGEQPNKKAQSYHSGDTRDIAYFSQQLAAKYPKAPLMIIGFSLGGNVLSQYLAKHPKNPYFGAAIICAPLDLASCSRRINRGFSRVYQKYLVDMLRNNAKQKINAKLITDICPHQLASINTIWEFDHLVTAPINGFASAEDYYQQASGKKVLANIAQPCLIVHAADDPFLNHEQVVANIKLSQYVQFEVSHHGGHVGFIAGNNPFKPIYWLEQRVPDFFSKLLSEQ